MSTVLSSTLKYLIPSLKFLGDTVSSPESASAPSSLSPRSLRRNEHLAVLLPKHLWKSDSQASHCDVFSCRRPFTLFDRRHHCRKCGGIFCANCSLHSIPLLDTSNLNFIHPPRGLPITAFESPSSPIVQARVCVECHDQINGLPALPKTPELSFSSPLTCDTKLPRSSSSSIVSTPSDSVSHLPRPTVRRTHTLPDFPQIPPSPPANGPGSDGDLGELAAYPLRHSSAVCKKTGGGRWYPKKTNTIEGYRIPGCKAQFEIDMEREEEERRRLKLNPVFKDGDFQYRVPREIEPQSLRGVGPLVLSTF